MLIFIPRTLNNHVAVESANSPIISKENKVKSLESEPIKKADPVEAVLLKELVPICACESTGSKYKTPTHYEADGTVKRGKINKLDIGICQINLKYHESSATKMGLDLFKKGDNITYANYLYKKQGSTPWNWSRECWQ